MYLNLQSDKFELSNCNGSLYQWAVSTEHYDII